MCCYCSVAKLYVTLCAPMNCSMQFSLSVTVSQNLLKFIFIESVMLSNHVSSFLFCLLSFPVWGSFPMSQLFSSRDQSIGASASTSVLPVNIRSWVPLGLTCLISLQSKGLSRAFSSTTVRKHQFFGAQPSLSSNSHICTWLLEIL